MYWQEVKGFEACWNWLASRLTLGPLLDLPIPSGLKADLNSTPFAPPYATRFNYSHIAMHGLLTIIKNWSSDCIFKYCEH